MKRSFMILALITGSIGFSATAQVNVNVNIGNQPAWGPVGYERVDYYYMPDIDAYYYVPQRQFIYLEGRNWIFATGLPYRYRNYDLYRGYKVVVNEPRPYLRHKMYRQQYGHYRGIRGQHIIRDDHNERYRYRNNRGYEGRGNGHGNKHGGGHGNGKHHGKHGD
jgi:hypothetical protein